MCLLGRGPLVDFQIPNLRFPLGPDVLRRQVVGAAMGGFISPACTQYIASMQEYCCVRTFIESGLLCAARYDTYMDDTFMIAHLSVHAGRRHSPPHDAHVRAHWS